MFFDSNTPFVTLDKNFNVIFAHEDIYKHYRELCKPGYFAALLNNFSLSDLSRPVILNTNQPLSSPALIAAVAEEDKINCYVINTIGKHPQDRYNTVSYQLREPVSSIFALLPLIADNINNDNGDKAIQYLEEVSLKSYRLLRNITNISLAHKILNKNTIHTSAINLTSVIESIVYSVKAVEPDISINCQLDSNIIINANHGLIINAVLNLISNSINFRTDEPVEINIRLSGGKNSATLSYRDNSKGIKSEYQNFVFDPYFSVDPYGDGNPSHELGLGLFIAKSAFSISGGTVLLTSNFGEGVKYSVSMPMCRCAETVMESTATDFLLNRYSEVFVQLCDSCKLPPLK